MRSSTLLPRFTRPIGLVGDVSGAVGPGTFGEVMVSIRGGREAFYALPADGHEKIEIGAKALVVEYLPPRTVLVSRYEEPC